MPSAFLPLKTLATNTLRTFLILLGGVLLVGLGARLEIPMVPVPMSMQTYAVVVLGALAGLRLGSTMIALYLAAGAAGAPVFAGGASGVEHLVGATAGYLVGFLVTAAVVGVLAERGWASRSFLSSTLVMALGHAVVLGLGTFWLGWKIGWWPAVEKGFLPFLLGGLVKSLLAAGTVFLVKQFTKRSYPAAGSS